MPRVVDLIPKMRVWHNGEAKTVWSNPHTLDKDHVSICLDGVYQQFGAEDEITVLGEVYDDDND